jgi:AraC-like DNA-binding protein
MHLGAVDLNRVAPTASTASAVSALFVYELDRDTAGVAMPRAESHLVVRFGPAAHGGLDIHALGAQPRAHRKRLQSGQRALMARLKLGAHERVLGVPASAIAGRIVALEDLWGGAATRVLSERLADAPTTVAALAILESAIAERVAVADVGSSRAGLILDAADRLASANVNAVAAGLGVSERHLRRVFREAVGVSPKTFAKLERFRRAVRAAYEAPQMSWARVAASAGYYDQAHLIAEFRALAGATPQALLGELRAAPSALDSRT